jgi:hypothetical protein
MRMCALSEPLTQVTQAVDRTVADTLRLVERLRVDLVVRIGGAQGFEASRLRELLDAVDASIVRFREDYGALLEQGRTELATLGGEVVQTAVAGLGIDIIVPDLTTDILQSLTNVTAQLVTNISTSLQAGLAREVQLGVLGIKSPFEVIQEIDRLLDAKGAKAYAARAETITRTEVGRAQSEASQAHLENAARQGVPVRKQWLHSGNRNPRSAHVAASGQIRPVREPFVINGVRLMYPRDAAAPPGETVNCRCVVVPYLG